MNKLTCLLIGIYLPICIIIIGFPWIPTLLSNLENIDIYNCLSIVIDDITYSTWYSIIKIVNIIILILLSGYLGYIGKKEDNETSK